MDRSRVVKTTLQDQDDRGIIPDASPSERMAMVWPMTLDAWAFMDPTGANPNFKDMLSALNDAGVEYLVVGAYAMAAHDGCKWLSAVDRRH